MLLLDCIEKYVVTSSKMVKYRFEGRTVYENQQILQCYDTSGTIKIMSNANTSYIIAFTSAFCSYTPSYMRLYTVHVHIHPHTCVYIHVRGHVKYLYNIPVFMFLTSFSHTVTSIKKNINKLKYFVKIQEMRRNSDDALEKVKLARCRVTR